MKMIEEINKLLDIDESYKAPEKLLNIIYDKERRTILFKQLLELFNYDVSYDWFRDYFEQEQSERKSKKQDFTPQCVTELVSKLVGKSDFTYDCCCGTGGILISKWYNDCLSTTPQNYNPSNYFYFGEEYSDRSIPFLLCNLMIRGMNAIVVQCDVLTRKSKGVFYIANSSNNFLGFSDFNVMPYNEQVEEYFNVKFQSEYYEKHIETQLDGDLVEN